MWGKIHDVWFEIRREEERMKRVIDYKIITSLKL